MIHPTAQELSYRKETVQKTLKEARFFLYLISLLHEITITDFPSSVSHYNLFYERLSSQLKVTPLIFFSNETWFHLSTYVNLQNYHIWSTSTPHVFQGTRLHSIKGGGVAKFPKPFCWSNLKE